MDLTELLESVDAKFASGKLSDTASDYYDKSVETHVQNIVRLKKKAAASNLERLEESLGKEGKVELLGNRVVEDSSTSVSLYALEGTEEDDGSRMRSLLLVARRWSDKGKITEEEYLPVHSTADAQPYFPNVRLGNKQIQPRLGFISQTRKRRAKGGGRPRKPIADTDLHVLPSVGKTVLEAFQRAGLTTFQALSEATDAVLETVRSESGRRFVNFDASYWREAAGFAARKDWEAMPPVPKAQKKTKKDDKVDFTKVGDRDLHLVDKVGPNMLKAFHSEGVETFQDLAELSDEKLEVLREKGGRPFVNFDMSFFRTVGQKKLKGVRFMPDPPKPSSKKGGAKVGRKPREINPNDIHVLPGVGAQLVAALHEAGINTFADIAEAAKEVLAEARSKTRGKYKNIALGYLQRQAKYAAAGKFEKIDEEIKLEKATEPTKVSAADRMRARLSKGDATDLQALPGVGPSVAEAMKAKGISTYGELAKANSDDLREIAQNAGKRFARFDVEFWKKVAQLAHDGSYDEIPVKAPKAPKPKPSGKKRGGQRGPRQARPPRQPKDNKDLGALPSIGATIIAALNDAGIKTFSQLASASEAKLEQVRAASGPKYKTFPVAYWKEVAGIAKAGSMEYPPVPKKEKKESTGRRGRAPKEVQPTDLRRLANVGPSMEKALRDNGLNTFQDIVDTESWRLSKAASEAGRRFANLDPEELKKAARDAVNGKFAEPTKRSRKSSLPEGADKLTELPKIGKKVQSLMFERGIKTYQDIEAAPIGALEAIRDEIGKILGKYDVRKWKEAASYAVQGKWSKVDPEKFEDSLDASDKRTRTPKAPKGGDDLTRLKGVKPSTARFFNSRGIKTYNDVLQLSDDALMALLEDSNAGVKPEDFAKVQESAAKQLSKGSSTKNEKAKK